MMLKCWITGFNPFDLDGSGGLKEINLNTILNVDSPLLTSSDYLIEITSTAALVAVGSQLHHHSSITDHSNRIDFGSRIAQLSASSWHCLVLLDNGDLHMYDTDQSRGTKLDFLAVENSSNTGEKERLTHIACGDQVSVAITSHKSVFNIPNKTFTFPRHVRIAKVVTGLEHCLLLTSNGDVYSWGGGLRGQLGNGEITSHQEQPQLIEALGGVKIVDIAAGGWHSGAISSFGDLYSWGWNNRGQLGLVDEQQTKGGVFSLPQLIELDSVDEGGDDISLEKVYCGSGHTVVISAKGEIYFAGNDLERKLDYTKIERSPKMDGFKKLTLCSELEGNARLKCCGPNTMVFAGKAGDGKPTG